MGEQLLRTVGSAALNSIGVRGGCNRDGSDNVLAQF